METSNKSISTNAKLLSKLKLLEESLLEARENEVKANRQKEIACKVLESINAKYIVASDKGVILQISPSLCEDFSITDDNLIGQNIKDLEEIKCFNIHDFIIEKHDDLYQDQRCTIYIQNKVCENIGQASGFIEMLPAAIVQIDREGKVLVINKKGLELFGDNQSLNIENIFQSIINAQLLSDLKQTIKSGKSVIGNKTMFQLNKDFVFLDYSIMPVLEKDDVSGAILVVQNENKKVGRQEELLRILTALDNTGVAILTTDKNYNITYANDSAVYLWGFEKKEEIINKGNIRDYFDEESFKRIDCQWEKMIGEKVYFFNDMLKAICNEGEIPLEVKGTMMLDAYENPLGITMTLIDMREQIKARDELISAKEKAEESDRLKSAFLANMSHEIRTPMNGILGFSSLLKKTGVSEEMKNKYIQLINANGENLVRIIDDIIDISKIESGQLKLCEHESNINLLLVEISMFFEKQLKKTGKEGVKLIMNIIPESDVFLITDTLRLKQILMNLIENAIKFTNHGRVEFGYKIDREENNILFFVKDSGIGIPYEKQHVIFDRFYQLDDSPTREHGGTGLGLAISKNLIEMMGGKIWVESRPGEGSDFKFILTNKQKRVIEKPEKATEEDGYTEYNWKGSKILIVEDEENNYFLLLEFLKETGAEIIWAKDGIEGVEKFEKNNVDIVLLDIKIPNLSGYEVLKRIKKINPKIPVIAQTAYALAGDKEKILKAGCDDYLSKPIEMEKILQAISKYIHSGA